MADPGLDRIASRVNARVAGLARGGMFVVAVLAMAGAAHAVVSERHLQGVKSLTCELEISETKFTLTVSTRNRTLTLADAGTRIPYADVSENVLRFALRLPGESAALECDLELPAGSLSCAPPGAAVDSRDGRVLGYCITAR